MLVFTNKKAESYFLFLFKLIKIKISFFNETLQEKQILKAEMYQNINVKYPNTIGNSSNFASTFNESSNLFGINSHNSMQLNPNYSEFNHYNNNYIINNPNNINNSCIGIGSRSDSSNNCSDLSTDFKQNLNHKANMLNNSHANFNIYNNHVQMQQQLQHQVDEQNIFFQNQKFQHNQYLDQAIISNYRNNTHSSFYSNDSLAGSVATHNLLQSLHLENQSYKEEPQAISSPIISYNTNFNSSPIGEAKVSIEANFVDKKASKKNMKNLYNDSNNSLYQNYSAIINNEAVRPTLSLYSNEQPMDYYHQSYSGVENMSKNEVRINKNFGLPNEDWINRLKDKKDITKKECGHDRNNDSWSKASDDSDPFRNGATLRERNRMHILNDAFDDLRKMVPKPNSNEHQRLSKIATLRQAINYISCLTNYLQINGGCKPVDASTLPAPPRRRRRRKFPKVNPSERNTEIGNNAIGLNQKSEIKIEINNRNAQESLNLINGNDLEIKAKKKKIKLDKKKINSRNF